MTRFFVLQSADEATMYGKFSPFQFASNANYHNMVDIEFLDSFSCSCKRIRFSDCSQLIVVNFQWPATVLLIFRAHVSFAKFLEPLMHCKFIRNSWAKCTVNVAGCLCYFLNLTPFELEKENCFSCHLISKFAFCLISFP